MCCFLKAPLPDKGFALRKLQGLLYLEVVTRNRAPDISILFGEDITSADSKGVPFGVIGHILGKEFGGIIYIYIYI